MSAVLYIFVVRGPQSFNKNISSRKRLADFNGTLHEKRTWLQGNLRELENENRKRRKGWTGRKEKKKERKR